MRSITYAGKAGRIVALLVVFAAGLAGGALITRAITPEPPAAINLRPLDIPSNMLTVTIVPLVPSKEVAAQQGGKDAEVYQTARQLVSRDSLNAMTAELAAVFPFNYVVSEEVELPDEFYDSARGQYRIDSITDWLADNRNPESFRTIGVLAEDVYKPQYNFLFGLAKIVGPACVASARRMDGFVLGARTTARQRFSAVMAHELGHTLGLQHNETEASLMAYSDTLTGLDRQIRTLSNGDRVRLRQILPVRWISRTKLE